MQRNFAKLALENKGNIFPLLIDSKESGHTGLTNPSVFFDGKELIFNIRNVEYALYHSEFGQKFQNHWGCLAYINPEDDITLRTNNFIGGSFNCKKVNTSLHDKKPLWEFIGLEDARIVVWDKKLYLCGVRRDTTTNGVGRMELSEIDSEGKEINRYRIEPPSGYTYCEKNWMPILDKPFHFVKWSNPTEIVKVDINSGTSETVLLNWNTKEFPRDIRGGSQVVPWKGGYVAITHEVDLWHNQKNNKDAEYYHRFIFWSKDWEIVAWSDAFKFMDAKIEFCCGLAHVEDHFVATFGFQDTTAFVLKMSEQIVEDMLDKKELKPNSKFNANSPIEKFACSTRNPERNYELGLNYFSDGHYASALSFFLRTAELAELQNKSDKTLTYNALILVAVCLARMGRRRHSEKSALLNAMAFDPSRYEAFYLLSQWYETEQDYFNCYAMSNIALRNYELNDFEFLPIMYMAKYKLIFQVAFSAWWVGKFDESRSLFFELSNKYGHALNEQYKQLVQSNITRLGSGDKFINYFKENQDNLKFKFPYSHLIERNYSQTFQDMFVLMMTEGKKQGTYLEIGSADPEYGSNTKLLESKFDWTGMGIEILESEVEKHKASRTNPVLCKNALEVDYDKLLTEMSIKHGNGFDFDYLQVDCEPPSVSFEILKMIPFDKFRFAVVTFEHDYYADVSKSIRKESREFMESKGYKLIVPNVSMNDDCPYEDWWIHPELVAPETYKDVITDKEVVNVGKYFLAD